MHWGIDVENVQSAENRVADRSFGVGLLLVGVIAVLLLQFSNFVFTQNPQAYDSNWTQVVFVFRVIAIPLFVLFAVWLAASHFPHVKVPLLRRRFLKEFCWATLGNIIIVELLIFNFISGSLGLSGHIGISIGKNFFSWLTFGAFLLTFLATWNYRKSDITNEEEKVRFSLVTLLEHGLIFTVSFLWLLFYVINPSVLALE